MEPNRARLARDLEALAGLTEPGTWTRRSFSPEDQRARAHLVRLMVEEAGLAVGLDPAANLIGRRPGLLPEKAPVILVGSHLDTVPDGGRFDGVAGVAAALEVARLVEENRVRLRHPLEVVAFTAEEPSVFGPSTFGSRAMAGRLPAGCLDLLDPSGRTLAQALADLGGDPARLPQAARRPGELLACLELHIEQGPVLFEAGVPLGLVTGIFGIRRGRLEITGRADHAGTTPMNRRRDALAAAAEAILALERAALAQPGVVATAGRIAAWPGGANVVPGRVLLEVEARGPDDPGLDDALAEFEAALAGIKARRGVELEYRMSPTFRPVAFDQRVRAALAAASAELGLPSLELASGAGHDIGHLAALAPAGMLFIPCREGRSHCPEEWAELDHLALGTQVLAQAVLAVDEWGSN